MGVDRVDVVQAVQGVERAQRTLQQAQHELEAAVIAARVAGATWAQIGDAVGMSRQSAHERWGHVPRAGCQRQDCDCVEHRMDDCPCGHGPGRGRRRGAGRREVLRLQE